MFFTNFFPIAVELAGSSGNPDVIMEELVASSSTLAEMSSQNETSNLDGESKALTQKIILILNNFFDQVRLATLEENKETNNPAVVSTEMLSFLKKSKSLFPKV